MLTYIPITAQVANVELVQLLDTAVLLMYSNITWTTAFAFWTTLELPQKMAGL